MKTDSPQTNPPLLSLLVNEMRQQFKVKGVVYGGVSCNTLFFSTAGLLLPGGHADGLAQRSDEGGQTDEVAVLSAPLSPRDVVSELARVRHRRRLREVYHPHAGLAAVVVDKEKRAANHLIRSNIEIIISAKKTSGFNVVLIGS